MAGVLADVGLLAVFILTGIVAGSLTIISEAIRGGLLLQIEIVALIVIRRKNRLQLSDYDFGIGKIEQTVNLLIGLGMMICAVWIIQAAYERAAEHAIRWPVGLTVAALVGELNLVLNVWAYLLVLRQARDGTSLMVSSYCRVRLVKLVTSVIVQVALTISARAPDSEVGALADAVGSAFVAVVMMWIGYGMLRAGLPDLLDRTLAEARQVQINQVLTRHFGAFDALVSVGSRRAGNEHHIDIGLGFAPDTTIDDIQQRSDRIADDLASLVPGAVVSVVPSSFEVVAQRRTT